MPNNSSHKKLPNSDSSNSEECVIVEKAVSNRQHFLKSRGASIFPQAEDEKSYGNCLRTKRQHTEIISPRQENTRFQSNNEEPNADTSANGFVTARVKLVYLFSFFFMICSS